METIGGRAESPIEIVGRLTRRSKVNKSTTTTPNESKDQENVNNTILVQNNADTTTLDEVTKSNTSEEKLHAATANFNSSTPRRKKDPLANLHSNLSPKYIGFTTPPNQLNNSLEERTRSLRKRHNNSSCEISEDKEELAFTPNNEGTVGFVRRTPRNRESQITPDNSIKRKKFVSPIDKLLIKNGAVMEYKNNLPLINNNEETLKNETFVNNNHINHLDEKDLGVRELDNFDEKSQSDEIESTTMESDLNKDKCKDLAHFGESAESNQIASNSFENNFDKSERNDLANFEENPETAIASNSTENDGDKSEGKEAEECVSVCTEISELINTDNDDDSKVEVDENDVDLNFPSKDEDMKNSRNKECLELSICETSCPDKAEIRQEEFEENIAEAENLPAEKSLDIEVPEDNSKKEEPATLTIDEVEVQQSQQQEQETDKEKLYVKEEISDDEIGSTNSLPAIEETIRNPLETVEKSKTSLVTIKLESVENDNNNDGQVDTPTAQANSPSAVSMDSAKGSSIINEGSWVSFTTGDLYWGQIYNFCYWPCMVCPDPNGKTIATEEMGRSADQIILVHVRFFADNGRRNWVKRDNLMPYVGIENYQERIVEIREKYGSKSAKYKLYVPTKRKEQVWFEAVNEANMVAEVAYPDRLEKFYEIFEKSKAFHKLQIQRRKSMYISVNSGTGSDIESIYGSNDNINRLSLAAAIKNKRERSISPYSPAYSPIKPVAAKRRKLSRDQELANSSSSEALAAATKSETNPNNTDLNLSQTNSVASTSSNTNSLNDFEFFSGLEFRRFYAVMKDFVMEQNANEKLEKSLVVAVRNIWALKQLNRRQMERKIRDSLNDTDDMSPALALTNARPTGDGSVKRLSSRLKSIMVRKSLTAPQNLDSTLDRPVTPQPLIKESQNEEKIKKPINRPILEVIDDIFDLDRKYLFRGMSREPVCKYCVKPGGTLRKCAKNCTYWLHQECLYKDFSQKGRRSHKTLNGAKTSNDKLNGSQSSSLVSLTEVGTADHVTGDSANIAVDVICKECANNEPTKCMVCNCTESKKADDPLVKCTMAQCERSFHPTCCKYWPQAKITISKNIIESFRCPSHVCHTCVSDDPKGKFQHLSNAKLTKCVKCPATFHTDSTCIPAGSQVLTAAHIICPRHSSTKPDMTVNVNWCFICVGGGQLTCCETCPTAVHAHCLNIPIDANEGYICEECESGRMPLYGEMVWAKFNNFRWWPAIILPPTEIPKNIARKTHNPSDFVVRFFGTHDHGWISRRRVYLYLEGDSSEPPKSKSSLDLSYNKGVEEAKEIYEIIKAKKVEQRNSNENKEKLHPQPYVRIKANRAVPPVKLHVDMESVSKCECDPREENPCGPDTNCLNRVLYHECNPKLCPAGDRCQNQMFESRVSPRLDVVYMKERGFGLVCRELIKAGTFVIEYVGEIINDDEFQARMKQKSLNRDENFYFLSVEKDYIIDAGPKGNLARFMNHSCDPNCETQKWSVNSLNRVGLFAIRDIPENTELTFNYHWDDLLGNEKKTCYCGAKKCAGQIGAKLKDMETLKELPAMIDSGKNKSKIKSKPNKKLHNNRGLKNKLVSRLKTKTKTITKKVSAAAVVSSLLKKNGSSTAANTNKDVTEESDAKDETSTSRLLESPDIFA